MTLLIFPLRTIENGDGKRGPPPIFQCLLAGAASLLQMILICIKICLLHFYSYSQQASPHGEKLPVIVIFQETR